MKTTNFPKLKELHQKAVKHGVGSKQWIEFATTMMESFPEIYESVQTMNMELLQCQQEIKGKDCQKHLSRLIDDAKWWC